MQSKWLSAAFAAALILPMPWSAQAFECPKHIEAAEDAIDAANDSMIGLKSDLHMHRGHMLLDDAKMLLGSILETSDRAKNETVRLIAREVRTYLEELKLKELLESILEGHTLDVNASFRLRKNGPSESDDDAQTEATDEADVELELRSETEDEEA